MLWIAAIVPALIGLWIVYRLDRRQEPPLLVLKLFALGALTVLPAGLLEKMLLDGYSATPDAPVGYLASLITAFFIAGTVEEAGKGIVFYRFVYKKAFFDEPYDAIVYAVAVSLGFAVVENVLYVMSSGLATAFVRAFTAIPGHLMFGIVMGSEFARARFEQGNIARAFVIPMLLHGTYDAFALAQGFIANALLIAYLMWLVRFTYFKIVSLRQPTSRQTVVDMGS